MFNIIILGLASFLTDISSEMIYPVLPLYLVGKLGASPAILGFIEGVAESLSSLLKVFSGYFSDRAQSRKPLTILGYAASAAGKFILYLSSCWAGVFISRVVDRFGKGVRTAPRDALIAESAQGGKRGAAFGLHRAMDSLGAVVGVLTVYFVIVFLKGEVKTVFLISLIPALIGVFILLLVREKKVRPKIQEEQKKQLPSLQWSLLDKRLKLFLVFAFIFTLGNSSNQFLLLKAQKMGNPLAMVLLFYLVYNVVYALSSYPAARLSDRIGRKKILVAGYFFYGLVYLGFALNNSSAGLWWLFGLYGLYIGMTDGVEKALLVDVAPEKLRGTVIGLHASLVGIGLLPASVLAGLLWNWFGPQATFYFGGLMGILASIGLWFILRGL